MRFIIKNNSGQNIEELMRLVQYHFMGFSQKDSSWSFTRPLGGAAYPRFHIYLKKNKNAEEIVLDLHLDQRKPMYQGAPHAHNADYEGEVVEKETERIKQSIV